MKGKSMRLPMKYGIGAMLLCTSLGATSAFADWKVDQRPQTLSIAKDLTYRYETVRNEIEKPGEGINARLAKIHSDLKTWIIDCAKLKARVDSVQGTQLGVFEAQLTEDAIQSAKKFDIIFSEAVEMRTKLRVMIESLQSARRANYELNTYQTEYQTLVSAVNNLTSNLMTTEEKLTDLVSDIRSTIPDLNSALLSRLKVNLISQNLGNVESAIASVQNLLATDKALDDLTKPLKADMKMFNKHFLEARYFSVIDMGAKLQNDCNSVKIKITNLRGHQGVKDSYLRATQSICTTVASNVNMYVAQKPGDVLSSGIHDLRLPRLKNRCKQTNPGLANCGMLVWLNNLTRDQIRTYDNNTLRGLEILWAEAEGEKEVKP